MKKYLIDTNAYFKIIKNFIIPEENTKEKMNEILKGECYISRLTQIEIISVIGKYSRGQSEIRQPCLKTLEDGTKCDHIFIQPKKKRWSQKKLHDWLKLEKEISEGICPFCSIRVLEVNENVIREAQTFILNALQYNFKSMDAMIAATAFAYSEEEKIVIVTEDKGLKAGMKAINYPVISL